MNRLLVGDPPFPAKEIEGRMIAKVEHIWHSVRRWAKQNGYQYTSSYGVIGVAPT
jgi:hypothetical protein